MNNIGELYLTQIARDINETAADHGFWEAPPHAFLMLNTKLLLIHSEVTEAMDVLRTPYDGEVHTYGMTLDQASDFFEELSDVIIRTLDLAGECGWNIGDTLLTKMEKNAHRPHMHGKVF